MNQEVFAPKQNVTNKAIAGKQWYVFEKILDSVKVYNTF